MRTSGRFYILFAVWVIYTTVLSGTPFAVIKDPAMKDVKEYDPLQHSHLVLRGRIERVTFQTRSVKEWGFNPKDSAPLTTPVVEIRVTEVLRGAWAESHLIGFSFWGERKFWQSDEEFIFCVKWHDTPTGRVAWIGELPGLYEHDLNGWVLRERFPTLGETPETLTYKQVENRVKEASLQSVADSSDVIARGIIDSVWTSKYTAKGGRHGVMEHRLVRITAWFKGPSQPDHVEFVVPVVGPSFVPRWYRAVPSGISRGTEWLVFLKKGVSGYYPFGGPNSLLQVRGNDLIYDGHVVYPLRLDDAARVIRAEARHADD